MMLQMSSSDWWFMGLIAFALIFGALFNNKWGPK